MLDMLFNGIYWMVSPRCVMNINLGKLPGDGEGKGGLACCSPWGGKVRDDLATKQQQCYLNFTFLFVLLKNDTTFLIDDFSNSCPTGLHLYLNLGNHITWLTV